MPADGESQQRERPRLDRFVERITLGRAVAGVICAAIGLTILGAGLLRLLNPGKFHTFGKASWLAVVTVTTVGYGDVVPSNDAGRVVAACLALLGVSLIPALTGLVVSILVTRRTGRDAEQRSEEQRELLAALREVESRLEKLEARPR
jgi:voltage-gated potassium channel